MSQENVEIVRDAVVAFNRGDLDAWLDQYWADDIDYRAAEGALDDHGPIHGKSAMRAYLQDWLDMFDDFKTEPVELVDAGEDQVIAVLRNSSVSRNPPPKACRFANGVLTQGVDPEPVRAAPGQIQPKENPAGAGLSLRAADGIRTHDLLHGKQTL